MSEGLTAEERAALGDERPAATPSPQMEQRIAALERRLAKLEKPGTVKPGTGIRVDGTLPGDVLVSASDDSGTSSTAAGGITANTKIYLTMDGGELVYQPFYVP